MAVVGNSSHRMLRIKSSRPIIISGMPIGAATTVNVKIKPITMAIIPRIHAINRPVILSIPVNTSQKILKGQKIHGICDWLFGIVKSPIMIEFKYRSVIFFNGIRCSSEKVARIKEVFDFHIIEKNKKKL